jgi:hypothetical protein
MKTAIFLTGRNNYELLDQIWAKNVNRDGVPVLSIDEDSDKAQKKLGKSVCEKHNIVYMDRAKRGMQNNTTTACDYFGPRGIEYLIWFQHDCWPLTNNFFSKFNKLVECGHLDKFGAIGFNTIATDVLMDHKKLLKTWKKTRPLGVMGRSWTTQYKWVSGSRLKKIPMVPHLEKYRKPCSIESVACFAIAINIKNFRKFIKPTSDLLMFHAWDDVCFQFLVNNIYNIFLPDLYLYHDTNVKPTVGIPRMSVKLARDGNDRYAGGWGHHEVWRKRWGYNFSDHDQFKKVASRYKGTLLHRIYTDQYRTGPIKVFDF